MTTTRIILTCIASLAWNGCEFAPAASSPAITLTWTGNDTLATSYALYANGVSFASASQPKFTGTVPKGIIWVTAKSETEESVPSNSITNE